MVDPIGTTLGAVSLCMQLVDGIAKGYQFYLAAVGMPADCAKMRAKLGMEYQRILAWTESAGILEWEEGKDIPEILTTNKFVLVEVLSQIRLLIDEFAEIHGKYEELHSIENNEMLEAKRQIDVVGTFSNIFDREQKLKKKRKYLRGTNHVLSALKNTGAIARNPRRLRWILFDREEFTNLLADLTSYNDYLFDLLQGQRGRSLIETTRNTFLEIIALRTRVDQLTVLMEATSVGRDVENSQERSKSNLDVDSIVQTLAEFKAASYLNMATKDPGIDLPEYGEAVGKSQLDAGKINFSVLAELQPANESVERPKASCMGNGHKNKVWIEWKYYETQNDDDKLVPREDNLRRTRELVALLQMRKPRELCLPTCFGFFDEAMIPSRRQHERRFGLVFKIPSSADANAGPQSLLKIMSDSSGTSFEPSLEERVLMASKLAMCIQYLHAVQWLHKGIRSDNILLFFDKEQQSPDLSNLLLSGFEYARPDRDGATFTGSVGKREDSWDLYRHPDYQGTSGEGHFRKTLDIYSLGIVLLEIAFWKPIHTIIGFEDISKLTRSEIEGVRDSILDPKAGMFRRLKARVGAKYAASVMDCITGCTAFDIDEEDDEMDAAVSVKLQRAFIERVTEPLSSVFRR